MPAGSYGIFYFEDNTKKGGMSLNDTGKKTETGCWH